MYAVALKMLIGDRGKYLGIIMGLTFASLLITQQSSIFTGLMTRTYGAITDLSLPDIWVMDPKVLFIDDIKPLQDTELYRVRGIPGVEWAVPLYKGLLKARLESGNFQICNVFGLDDATLIGGPPVMLEGSLSDLRRQDSIIVNDVGARTRLAKPPMKRTPPTSSSATSTMVSAAAIFRCSFSARQRHATQEQASDGGAPESDGRRAQPFLGGDFHKHWREADDASTEEEHEQGMRDTARWLVCNVPWAALQGHQGLVSSRAWMIITPRAMPASPGSAQGPSVSRRSTMTSFSSGRTTSACTPRPV